MKNILIGISLIFALNAFGNEFFEKGNEFFEKDSFKLALKYYHKAEKDGVFHSLYYNIGNTYFRLDSISYSILYFEKALRLKPGHKDTKENLSLANSKISDEFSGEFTPYSFLAKISLKKSEEFWAVWSLLLAFVTSASFIIYLLSKIRSIKVAFFRLGIIFIILFGFFFTEQILNVTTRNKHLEGIVSTYRLKVKSEPKKDSRESFILHEGSKIYILQEIGNWYEIITQDEAYGWIPKNLIQRI